MKTIEVISLIYKSPPYLEHIIKEFEKDVHQVDGYNVTFRIVANDPENQVLDKIFAEDRLKKYYNIFISIYNDLSPEDYYLNRVYRCYNFAAETSFADILCFVNSDMVFTPNWLQNLIKYYNGSTIPCSRLIESGRLRSGTYGIEKNFGMTLKDLDINSFLEYAKTISVDTYKDGGLFMPCLLDRNTFIESGMYPEGNLYKNAQGNITVGTRDGDVIMSGDAYFFLRLRQLYGLRQITVFDSLVYHLQEGEKSE